MATSESNFLTWADTVTTATTPNYLWVDDAFDPPQYLSTTSGTGGYINISANGISSTTTSVTGTISGWSINHNGVFVIDQPVIIEPPMVNVLTPEQIAEIELEETRRRARYRARQDAIAKADQLLVENLNEVQRQQYEQFGHFFVEGLSGRLYKIRKGRSINIDVMEDDKTVKRLCAHPQVDCPDQDTMLVQKIMLEHQEQEFLQVAHEWAA